MINEVTLIGYLGNDPKLVTPESKKHFVSMRLATSLRMEEKLKDEAYEVKEDKNKLAIFSLHMTQILILHESLQLLK